MASDGISPVLFSSGGLSEVSATTSDSAAAKALGSRVHVQGIDYIYVYNAGNEIISQGEMGFIPPDDLDAAYSVTVSNAASQAGVERVVGVAHNGTIATGDYGYLATRGLVLIALDGSETSMNSGVNLAPGVDGGFVALAAATTNTTGLRWGLGTTANSAVTTVGTSKAWFKSPIFG